MSEILGPDGKPVRLQFDKTKESRDDSSLPDGFKHKPVDAKAHISQKAYFFPPAFNALREELQSNWRDWFETPHKDLPRMVSPAVAMVYYAQEFVLVMNQFVGRGVDLDIPDATEIELQMAADKQYVPFDSGNVNGICHTFLNDLRKMRGVSAISL